MGMRSLLYKLCQTPQNGLYLSSKYIDLCFCKKIVRIIIASILLPKMIRGSQYNFVIGLWQKETEAPFKLAKEVPAVHRMFTIMKVSLGKHYR